MISSSLDVLWHYFDHIIPITIGGFAADMEVRPMQYWQK